MGLPSSPTKIGSSRFCVISLTYIGSINLCVLCVFVVRSRLSLGGMYLRIQEPKFQSGKTLIPSLNISGQATAQPNNKDA
ncbi:MAG: hypothetical protein EWV41_17365 [Microcystis wesenbergii Mw_MB_S_20031200_S109]|nr:MAG: hypothetical protein EWV41_17365 [Microcystis wesenbergii Mw_MB_S_20031200_S109]